jgi:hypothetical protein
LTVPRIVMALSRRIGLVLVLGAVSAFVLTTPAHPAAAIPTHSGPQRSWHAAVEDRLRAAGRAEEAEQVQRQAARGNWCFLTAGDLAVAFRQTPQGVQLESLFDLSQQTELLAANPLPLFTLTGCASGATNEARVSADVGWRQASVHRAGRGVQLRWEDPVEPALAGIAVMAEAKVDASRSALSWRFRVENVSSNWTLSRVVFPQVALTDLGPGGSVLFPRGPGEVQTNVWNRAFQYRGNYPGGWCAMQFVAAYRIGTAPTGLYLAVHDPWGSTKDIAVESQPDGHRVLLRFDHPTPDLGKAGNDFTLTGEAVWQLLRGDWYDAASIYRDWARREARWWPRSSSARQPATPRWFTELNVWALGGGAASECVPSVQAFQRFVGLPVGFHWYNWHQIPFDNDYPHYFPAKEGFAAGVAELKASGVFPMPYINGRLWDSHDRGAEDFEFTRRALSSATKQADGKPYLESYGSKETNGEPVRLAAMCPTTALWQETVRGTVLRLLGEVGTSAVYVDQIAAAAPTLCQDPTHGHPLGGGHWWSEGYWKMLEGIRAAMPRGGALTTECNGEPFIRWFDGYLTWHWQYDGQVPAFPAIYGGTIQMFGRAYRGGATKDLALRMKAGQQLVFGEQLGWLDPGLAQESDNAGFFRLVAQTRQRLNRYFSAGEMARPPRLTGNIPRVRADWQWSGEWWVTTDALLTGAWRLPRERRLVFLVVNVSNEPVSATVDFQPRSYGVRARHFRTQTLQALADGTTRNTPLPLAETASFPARSVETWEVRW